MMGIGLLGLTGCSKSGEAPDKSQAATPDTSQAAALDTSKLQSAFQSAPAVDKTEVQNAITAVKSQDYSGALASLQKVASDTNLTPEQKAAVDDFIGQVKAKGAELAKKALGTKTADLQKSLPK